MIVKDKLLSFHYHQLLIYIEQNDEIANVDITFKEEKTLHSGTSMIKRHNHIRNFSFYCQKFCFVSSNKTDDDVFFP